MHTIILQAHTLKDDPFPDSSSPVQPDHTADGQPIVSCISNQRHTIPPTLHIIRHRGLARVDNPDPNRHLNDLHDKIQYKPQHSANPLLLSQQVQDAG